MKTENMEKTRQQAIEEVVARWRKLSRGKPHCNNFEECNRKHIEAISKHEKEKDERREAEIEAWREKYLHSNTENKDRRKERAYKSSNGPKLSAEELNKLLTPSKWIVKKK